MAFTLSVENIKCGGCANTITTKLASLEGIKTVDVDIENGKVCVDGNDNQRETIINTLLKLGYPESGTVEGITAAKAKAKSFVSCAVGRMSK